MKESVSKRRAINSWSEDSRPREKLLKNGASALSNAELLAILIGSGSPNEDAVSLMTRILDDYKNQLDRFARTSYDDLVQYKGIGQAKALTLIAALEFARRRTELKPTKGTLLNTPKELYQFLCSKMQDLSVEVSWVILLNQKLCYVDDRCLSQGGITSTVVDPRLVLKYALSRNAAALVLAHNHPSGNTRPSQDDDNLTARLKKACEAVGIRFVDHLVISANGFYSYGESGKI